MFITLLSIGLFAWLSVGAWHVYKPLPGGLDVATPWAPAEDVAFLSDTTYTNPTGERQTSQAIFGEILRVVKGAERLVVLDMFLFNDFAGETGDGHQPLSRQLSRALIEQKRAHPDLQVVVITDPVNTVYGSRSPDHFERLEAAGIQVVVTDLKRLRDPNPLWSGLWRICCQWITPRAGSGWLPNPLGDGRIAASSWMQLLNFKANHRKTVVADDGDRWLGLVTSANPHDASSRHGNVALRFAGQSAVDLLATEQAVANLSGVAPAFSRPRASSLPADDEGRLRILTEGRVRAATLRLIDSAQHGDHLDLAMFYLSHREVIAALKQAQVRGVNVRVLLDPNHDAFGRQKNGIPNRPVGAELHHAGISLRWCLTSGEQCHSKFLLHRDREGHATLLLGSSNFTRRNLDNFNLETNVEWQAPVHHPAMRDAQRFFDARWSNGHGNRHSLPFEAFADDSPWRYWRYRFMEASGLSTF
ncbi:phospholipase D family protein [Guyparkeria sp. 1SP6A2]|nr:phospholipase D family protein [Guyparkeria sp. 1SP6A2]